MLPNIKSFLTGQPLTGLSGRIFDQLNQMEAMLPVQSAMIDESLSMPMENIDVPPISEVPIDKDKIASGYDVAEAAVIT